MQFTGRNLALVHTAITHALSDVYNDIATCPDPNEPEHAQALKDLEVLKDEFTRLRDHIDASGTCPDIVFVR